MLLLLGALFCWADGNLSDELATLARLHQEGSLTLSEFTVAKERVLKGDDDASNDSVTVRREESRERGEEEDRSQNDRPVFVCLEEDQVRGWIEDASRRDHGEQASMQQHEKRRADEQQETEETTSSTGGTSPPQLWLKNANGAAILFGANVDAGATLGYAEDGTGRGGLTTDKGFTAARVATADGTDLDLLNATAVKQDTASGDVVVRGDLSVAGDLGVAGKTKGTFGVSWTNPGAGVDGGWSAEDIDAHIRAPVRSVWDARHAAACSAVDGDGRHHCFLSTRHNLGVVVTWKSFVTNAESFTFAFGAMSFDDGKHRKHRVEYSYDADEEANAKWALAGSEEEHSDHTAVLTQEGEIALPGGSFTGNFYIRIVAFGGGVKSHTSGWNRIELGCKACESFALLPRPKIRGRSALGRAIGVHMLETLSQDIQADIWCSHAVGGMSGNAHMVKPRILGDGDNDPNRGTCTKECSAVGFSCVQGITRIAPDLNRGALARAGYMHAEHPHKGSCSIGWRSQFGETDCTQAGGTWAWLASQSGGSRHSSFYWTSSCGAATAGNGPTFCCCKG